MRLQEWDKAAADYSEVIKLHPRNTVAWSSRGQCHVHLGKHAAARVEHEIEGRLRQAVGKRLFHDAAVAGRQPSADGKNNCVRREVRREHPGALTIAGGETACDIGQRHVRNARVQHFHERSHGDDNCDQPGIELGPPLLRPLICNTSGLCRFWHKHPQSYRFRYTLGSSDIPTRSR